MGDRTERIDTLTSVGYKRTDVAEMEAIRQWLSINAARNIRLLMVGLKRLNLSSQVIWDNLPDKLKGKSVSSMLDDSDHITLDQYDNLIRKVVDEQLGHVSKLSFVGRASPDINFGFDAIGRLVAGVFGFMLSPWVLYQKLQEGAAAWNTNKSWYAYRTGECEVRLVCVYNPGGPQNKVVNRLQDAPALLHLIRGMNQAMPGILPGRDEGTVKYRLVELPIVPLLKMWAPEKDVHWNGKTLIIDGEVYGRLVWLKIDENGSCNGDYSDTPSGSVRGIRIEKDVLTPNKIVREGEPEQLPIVHTGEIYQIDDEQSPFLRTVLTVKWNRTLGDRLAALIPNAKRLTSKGDYEQTWTKERRATGRSMQAAKTAREAAILRAIARTVHPDPEFFARVQAGYNPLVADEETVAMTVDIVGFTAWSATLDDPIKVGQFMQPFMTGINQIVLNEGGKYNNFTGDGCVCVWMSALGKCKGMSLNLRLSMAIKAALEIATLADEVGKAVRIGISVGPTVTYTIPADETGIRAIPVTNGEAMNLSARAEGALKNFPMPEGSSIGLDASKVPHIQELPGLGKTFDVDYMGETKVKAQTFPFYVITPAEGSDSSAFVMSLSATMNVPTIFDVGDDDYDNPYEE